MKTKDVVQFAFGDMYVHINLLVNFVYSNLYGCLELGMLQQIYARYCTNL